MPTNQAKSFRRLCMAKWRTKVWNTHQQKPTETKVKMHQNRLPNPSAYNKSDNWHQWRNDNILLFFLIDNKSFIDEKEQCVYDCKLTALETNTIKSKGESNDNILRANIMAYSCCKFITKTLRTSRIKVVALCSLFTYGAFELQDFWAHGFGFGGLKSK